MALHPVRIFLYLWFFSISVALMGMTAYRTHYTKSLDHPDVLTTRQHFYTPIIVELLVVAILGTIWSMLILPILFFRIDGGILGSYLSECVGLSILFIMSLVGAAVVTHEFSNLAWCRSEEVCRILEAIKAFSWIFWGWTIFLLAASFFDLMRNRHGFLDPLHGRQDTNGNYPEVRAVGRGAAASGGGATGPGRHQAEA